MSRLFEQIKTQDYVIIAEIGVNYYDIACKLDISVLEAAKLMCEKAHEAGADAVKFQTYRAEKIASKYSPSYWDTTEEETTSQYELFRKYDHFGEKEYQEIAAYCKELDVIFMSTPFDFEAADYLDGLMEEYKISSSDLSNIPFIEHICKKNKPIILSTGASDEKEIERATQVISSYGNELALLHCVLEYPTPKEHANLKRITALAQRYPGCIIGYSDHTKPTENEEVITTAYVLGAKIIEKHFTLDKTIPGNDHYHAMDETDLAKIKNALENEKLILGKGGLSYLESEKTARANARRSIVTTKYLKAGSVLGDQDITFKRPGLGITPDDYKKVLGRELIHDVQEDYILQWGDLK